MTSIPRYTLNFWKQHICQLLHVHRLDAILLLIG